MRDIFIALLYAGSITVIIAVGWVLWTIKYDPQKIVALNLNFSRQSIPERVLSVFAAIGICLVVFVGIDGLLSWMPLTWGVRDDDGRWMPLSTMIGGPAGLLGGFVLIGTLIDYCNMRERIEILSTLRDEAEADLDWTKNQIRWLGSNMTEGELRDIVSHRPLSGLRSMERAAASLELLRALNSREEKAIEEARLREEEKRRKDDEKAKALERDREIEAAAVELETALDKRPPSFVNFDDLNTHKVCLIDHTVTGQIWDRFVSATAMRNLSAEAATRKALTHVNRLIDDTIGMRLKCGATLTSEFRGDAHGAEIHLGATINGFHAELASALWVEDDSHALVTAFFLSTINQTSWAEWHGLYERDFVFVFDVEMLKKSAVDFAKGSALSTLYDDKTIPYPGVRIERKFSGLQLSCLALRPGGNLFDVSVTLNSDNGTGVSMTSILVGGQVYY